MRVRQLGVASIVGAQPLGAFIAGQQREGGEARQIASVVKNQFRFQSAVGGEQVFAELWQLPAVLAYLVLLGVSGLYFPSTAALGAVLFWRGVDTSRHSSISISRAEAPS